MLGIIARSGEVVVKMLPDVKQITIEPEITAAVARGSLNSHR